MNRRHFLTGLGASLVVARKADACDYTRICFFSDTVSAHKNPLVGAPAFAAIAAKQPHAVVACGDWDHRNPASNPDPNTFTNMWNDLTTPVTAMGHDWETHIKPLPNHDLVTWDDHDYCTNNSDKHCSRRGAARVAFKNAWPDFYPHPGINRERVVEAIHVILLDTRSYRDSNGKFDDINKQMLGQLQEDWLVDNVATSSCPLVVVVTSVPWHNGKHNDSWDAFATRRQHLANRLSPHVSPARRLVMVSGDVHRGAIDDGRCTVGGFPELNLPNLNMPNQNTLGQMPCWSQGLFPEHVSGFGMIEISRNTIALRNFDTFGAERQKLEIAR